MDDFAKSDGSDVAQRGSNSSFQKLEYRHTAVYGVQATTKPVVISMHICK